MDKNGIPTIIGQGGVFSEAASQRAITQAQSPQVSIPSLVAAIIGESEDAQRIIIDLYNRKVHAVNSSADYVTALDAAGEHKVATFGPLAGSEGRTFEWEQKSRTSGMSATLADLVKAEVDPARPVRSLTTMVSMVLDQIPNDIATDWFVEVDQAAGTVKLLQITTDLEDYHQVLSDIAADSGDNSTVTNLISIELAEPSEAEESSSLKFEGGAF